MKLNNVYSWRPYIWLPIFATVLQKVHFVTKKTHFYRRNNMVAIIERWPNIYFVSKCLPIRGKFWHLGTNLLLIGDQKGSNKRWTILVTEPLWRPKYCLLAYCFQPRDFGDKRNDETKLVDNDAWRQNLIF